MKRKPKQPPKTQPQDTTPPQPATPPESPTDDDPLRQFIESLIKPPVEPEMSDEEQTMLSKMLTDFHEREQQRAALVEANNARWQRAYDLASERFPGKATQNFEAFMNEVLKIYKALD